jgi:hypothetical protein
MRFSKEPIIWVGAIIAVAMVVKDYLTGDLNLQSLDALGVAIGALIGRQLVSPVAKEE